MFKPFKWDDKYSVNVPTLDAQHKRFFEITNQILQAVETPPVYGRKEKLTLLVVELCNYALDHLSYEENCMKDGHCSGCSAHTEVHDLFRVRVKEYLSLSTKDGTDLNALAKEIAEFSQNWLSSHILSRDMEYKPCLGKVVIK